MGQGIILSLHQYETADIPCVYGDGSGNRMNKRYFKTPDEWRIWLQHHHDAENEVWLVFFRKETGEPSIAYEAAVEEALCFGWIDSIIKKMDERRYVRKFTPRNDNSVWSKRNKERVARLMADNRMTEAGMAKIEAAKRNGWWDKLTAADTCFQMPAAFRSALAENPVALELFNKLSPGYRKRYIGWIAAAKRPETRDRRIRESIALLENGQKLGMK